jgi:FKBP-type peptidyl-prolyl cis-trans isomerase
MKHTTIPFHALSAALAMALLGSPAVHAQATPEANKESVAPAAVPTGFASHKDALSYAIGVSTARNLAKDGVDFDPSLVSKGMQDALSGKRLDMSEADISSQMNSLLKDMRQQMAANRRELEETNKKKGDEYRANFAKQPGVSTLPSGLQYKAEKTGSGPKPTEEDMVVFNYRGTLLDGKEFASTAPGTPGQARLDAQVNGLKEALKLMPAGSRWTVVVPGAMGYGARGMAATIPPNSTLVYDVELLRVIKGTPN